jgi:hypothetical protein
MMKIFFRAKRSKDIAALVKYAKQKQIALQVGNVMMITNVLQHAIK